MKLWLEYSEYTEVIQDDYGNDGPYTGYREDQNHVTFHSLRKNDPKDGLRFECIEFSLKEWNSVQEALKVSGLDFQDEEFAFKDWLEEKGFSLKELWLVVVRYTEGGTFGSTHGYWKVKGVFPNEKEAKECKELIHSGKFPKLKYAMGSRWFEGMNEWEGYFGGLDGVEIHRFEVRD